MPLTFHTPEAFRTWLTENHTLEEGIWIRFYKKASGVTAITYPQALDEALCFGWIDGQARPLDEHSWQQKFTPRRPRSIWSKRNKEHVARLVKEKRMTPAGMRAVDAAKADGRWDAAYDSPKNMQIPEDFLKEVAKFKRAHAFMQTLNKANLYAIAWRLQTAKKPETRERRKKVILEMLKAGKKFH
jgi:uncharacterized protein YdeI (YjbR/CyaY-like superfamily)